MLALRQTAFVLFLLPAAIYAQGFMMLGLPMIALFEFIDGGERPFRTAWQELVTEGPLRETWASWPD